MSPTSYQAAPPRMFTIAESEYSVKLLESWEFVAPPGRDLLRERFVRPPADYQVLYGVPSLPI
jgi:hypothetical protein